jgi:hypothetical protein
MKKDILNVGSPENDEAEALAWLDDALDQVTAAGQTRIESYLRLIRADLLEQMASSGRPSKDGHGIPQR